MWGLGVDTLPSKVTAMAANYAVFKYGMRYGKLVVVKPPRPEMRKITLLLPKELVERATRASGLGITPTIRQGLETVAAAEAYENLRKSRGKVRLSINLEELRRD